MAHFKLTFDEYAEYRRDLLKQPNKSMPKRTMPFLALAVLLVISIVLKQYAFAAVVIAFAGLVWWSTRQGLSSEAKRRFNQSRFINGELEVLLSEGLVKVHLGPNKMDLAVSDLNLVRNLEKAYYLNHASGVELFVPHRVTTNEERSFLEIYREKYDDNYRLEA